MIVLAVPPTTRRADLRRACSEAEQSGFDALLFAELPVGGWAAAAEAAAFVASHTSLQLGIALNVDDRHPLAIAEEIAVAQYLLGPGLWIGLGGNNLDALADVERLLLPGSPIRPPAVPVAPSPWRITDDRSNTDAHKPILTRADLAASQRAEGAYGSSGELLDAYTAELRVAVWVVQPDPHESIGQAARFAARLRLGDVSQAAWLTVAMERLSARQRESEQ